MNPHLVLHGLANVRFRARVVAVRLQMADRKKKEKTVHRSAEESRGRSRMKRKVNRRIGLLVAAALGGLPLGLRLLLLQLAVHWIAAYGAKGSNGGRGGGGGYRR
jgi:hypothetical protein